jgi:hypothetical protein
LPLQSVEQLYSVERPIDDSERLLALLQRSILAKLELRQPFEKSGFPTGQKRRFLIFATEPSEAPSRLVPALPA